MCSRSRCLDGLSVMLTCRNAIVLTVLLLSLGPLAGSPAQARHRGHHRRPGALPYMGPEPAPSIFGLDTDLYDSNYADTVRDFPTARQLGGRWDHFVAGPLTGNGNYALLDRQVTQARRSGMGVIVSFGGITAVCSLRPLPADLGACPPTTRPDLRRYQAYVRRLVLRYRRVVTYYESWVEPNNGEKWLPRDDAASYAALLRAEYSVFQAINRRYRLHLKLLFGSPINFSIIPGSTNATAVLPFVDRVLHDLHGQRPFDGIALHAYRFPAGTEGPDAPDCDYVRGVHLRLGYSTPDCPAPDWRLLTWPQELTAYEQQFERHGYGQTPLWVTEFGWPGSLLAAEPNIPDDVTQARYLIEAYNDLLQLPFVQAALWFNLRDYQPGYASPDPAFFYHYGLVDYGFAPKPAAAAFQALAAANPGR